MTQPEPATDVVITGYRVEELLSTDSVSSLHLATSDRADAASASDDAPARVVLRITHPLRADGAPDAPALAAYLRAARAAATLSHPALIDVVDSGRTNDRAYVVTADRDRGVTLDQYVRDHGRLARDDAVELLAGLAEALDHAHAAGIVHGAISPRTIVVHTNAADGAPARLDGYGLAGLLVRQARRNRAAIDVDDVAYTAPERLREGAVDGRADQYALACALYHCLTGGPPFERATAAGLFGAHLFSVPSMAALHNGDRALAGALSAGMARRPDQRHDSCVDLLRATGCAVPLRPSAVAPDRTAPSHVAPADARASGGLATPAAGTPVAGRPGDGRRGDGRPAGGRQADGGRDEGRADGAEDSPRVRRGVTWPVAAMAVLLGIVTTLVLAALARGGDVDLTGIDVAEQMASGSVAADVDAPATAGVAWQRPVADQPLYDVGLADDTVVAAAPHRVAVLSARRGAVRWTQPIEIGVLTDIAVTDQVVALRGPQFRGLAVGDGTRRWQKADIVAPINALATAGSTIYGVSGGRVAPELVALDAPTGTVRWTFDGGGERIDDAATVAASADTVALLDPDTLWVLDPDGPAAPDVGTSLAGEPRARWRAPVGGAWLDSLALLPDVVVVADRTGDVCAYDPADGEQRWCAPVTGVAAEAPTIVAARNVVVVVHGSRATALSIESGLPRWEHTASRPLTPIATSTGSEVIVSDDRGGAHALDLATGFEVWRASGFGAITALAGSPDAILVGTRAGLLVRLEPPVDLAT